MRWPGRLEIMQQDPLVILDCAKDARAMERLEETVETFSNKRLILVLSISSDKNIRAMVDEIAPISDSVIITAHKVMDRAAEPEIIAEAVARHSKGYVIIEDVKDAVKKAVSMAQKEDLVLVTGSLFTVAEAREIWYTQDSKTVYKD